MVEASIQMVIILGILIIVEAEEEEDIQKLKKSV